MKKKDTTTRKTLRLFWRFTRPNPFLFWYATLGSAVGILLNDIFPPLIVAAAFNRIQDLLAANQPITFAAMQPYMVVYVAISLAAVVVWRTEAYCGWLYMMYADQRIAEHVFQHIQRMGSRFHADRFGGAMVSQATKFGGAYNRLMSDFTWTIMTGVTALIASLIILAITSPVYAGVFTAVAAVYFISLYYRMKHQAPYNRAVSSSESDRTAKLADTITNVATVRAFAGEPQEAKLFRRQTDRTLRTQLDLTSVTMKNELVSQIGINSMNVLAFGGGILSLTMLSVPVGTLYLIITYTWSLTRRLWEAMFLLRNINRSLGEAAEMTEILHLEPEIADPAQPEPVRIHDGALEFRGVGFGYPGSPQKKSLFKNLNFTIQPGEKIGLVGHSGGGKTTITQLLLRFMDIQDGKILIDGQDISTITQNDLRAHITYVPQEPLLFHRTLAENISYGRPSASLKDIKLAAKLAHANEFIGDLPEGYDTLVGERGIKLSGGQRQRVAIARAMLKNSPILVLDEATSALDSESEKHIQAALWKLMEGRTALVIAHRLSTIQKMDRILVMEKGRIVETGSHKQLLAKKGVYANLWAHQSGGFLEE